MGGGVKRKLQEGQQGNAEHAALATSQEVVSKVLAAKAALEAHRSSSSKALIHEVSQLKDLGHLSTEVLRETQIGKLVGKVAKEVACDEARQMLAELLAEWKTAFRNTGKAAKTDVTDTNEIEQTPEKTSKSKANVPNASVDVEPLTLELYRKRLTEQQKFYDTKPGSRSLDVGLKDPPDMPPTVTIHAKAQPRPVLTEEGHLLFPDFPEFKPNLSPKQVLQAGSFGGTYFRDISSAVTGIRYKGKDVIKEFPEDWFHGLRVEDQVTSQDYRKTVNKYMVSCGGSLGMWETSGWISALDPYGWFQWYCRFYLGRRTSDDARQVDRWLKGQGPKGRWRLQLMNKVIKDCSKFDNAKVSPVIRQVLLHWAYELTSADLETYCNREDAKAKK